MHCNKNGIEHTRYTIKNLISHGKYVLLIMLMIFFSCVVFAAPQYTMDFNAMYNTTGGFDYQPVMGSCLTCHASGSVQNSYARDYRNTGHDFYAIELLDSDGDGFDNITEINGGSFPGDPNSLPAPSPGDPPPPSPVDTSAPLVTGILVPDAFYALTVPVQSFTAQDDTRVTGYLLTESPAVPSLTDPGWQPTAPTTFTFLSFGANSLYAWARDEAGNISQALMRSVNIEVYSPAADAGGVYACGAGDLVVLDGSASTDNGGGTITYSWSQSGGTTVTLSDADAVQPSFIAPDVGPGGEVLTFELVVTNSGGLQSTDACLVEVTPLTTMPWEGLPGIVSMDTCTGKTVGISVDGNAGILSMTDLNPVDIPDSQQKPMNMTYGLIDIRLSVDPGATATVTIHLPNPVPDGYHWYKYYNNTAQWEDYCCTNAIGAMGAVFNAARDQVTLTLTDGGIGDDDTMADGIISDPSGLGITAATGTPADPDQQANPGVSPEVSSGGGGGCFVSSTGARGSDIWTIPGIIMIPAAILALFLTITALILPLVKRSKTGANG